RSTDIQVTNNTVAYCGTTGIFIHNAKRISVQGNTLFSNGRYLTNKRNSQLSIQLDNLVLNNDKKIDLRIIENKFITLDENNHCVYLSAEQEQDLKALGLFDKNLYCAPFDNLV